MSGGGSSGRLWLSLGAPVAAGLAILAGVVVVADVDADRLRGLAASVSPAAFLLLVALTAINAALAGEKWGRVDERLGSGHLSRRQRFAFTAVGGAVGQILPMQVATAATRALCTRLATGAGVVRSAVGTFVEQGFDLVLALLLAPVSLACLALASAAPWPAGAAVAVAVAVAAVGPAADILRRVLRRVAAGRPRRLAATAEALRASGLVEGGLARHLLALSALRFAVLCVAAVATREAVGLEVPTLYLLVAMPLVVVASLIAMTPAGLGANELAFVAVMAALGTPVEVAASWALANRALTAAAAVAVGGAGLLMMRRAPRPAVYPD